VVSGAAVDRQPAPDLAGRFPGIGRGWARFDGPAGTQVVDTAIEAMAAYLSDGRNANGGGWFAASQATDAVIDGARARVARLLGADPGGVVFGANATSLVLAITRSVAQELDAGDEILCTQLDHDANITPWVLAARNTGARVFLAPIDRTTAELDVEVLAGLLSPRTRWLAITGASNAVGSIPDLARAVELAHQVGARVFVDAVHLVPHRPVDVASLGCDALVTSSYKWYGPHAGVLWLAPDLRDELTPYKVRPAPDAGPSRWETGTPSYEAIAGIDAAALFLLDEGMASIVAREAAIFAPLLRGLRELPSVTVYGPPDGSDRAPTVSFNLAGQRPAEVAAALADRGIAVWSGNYYALELMTALGLQDTGGAVRAGVNVYTSAEDVERLLDAVAAL
jgi:cysteine desulfurase family protein (TIGR01976 family)